MHEGHEASDEAHEEGNQDTTMAQIEVGILGATGMVGQQFIALLAKHPWFKVTWLGASERSAGKAYRDAAAWRLPTPGFNLRRRCFARDATVDVLTNARAQLPRRGEPAFAGCT